MSGRRVLVLAYHFPPIGGGGVQRNAKFVRYLRDHGYEPVVVTGPGGASDRWTPEDETLLREVPADVEVRRVPGPEPPISSGLRGAAERRLMLPSAFQRWWVEGAVKAARGLDVELVYGSLVPYESAQAAVRVAALVQRPWVADLQDPWVLDEMWLYPTELHRRVDLGRMRRILRTASAIVMNTPVAAARVTRAFPDLRSKLVTAIPNGFDQADFAGPPPERKDGRFRIVHTGYLHTADGLRLRRTRRLRRVLGGLASPVDILPRSHWYLLQALERLLAEEPGLEALVELVLAGVTNPVDRQVAEPFSFVRMPGYLSHPATVELVRSADLLFLPMHDLPPQTRAGLVPGKTYEYLAAGRPILAAVPDGDARDLLSAAGNAYLCRPTDVDAMAEHLRTALGRWRTGNGHATPDPAVVARYERRRLTALLADVFDRVVEGAKPPHDQQEATPL